MSKQSGKANAFQRDYLEHNMRGESFKGSTVTQVTNKYIHTADGEKHSKQGQHVSFEEKEHSPKTRHSRR
jgi:hypothetical protein